MTKSELEARITVLETLVVDMLETIECLDVDAEIVVVEKPGRKDEVLAILQRGKHVSVSQIAREVGISERNVSSQMSYLRKDGKRIATDSRGNKFLESDDAYKYRVLEHS